MITLIELQKRIQEDSQARSLWRWVADHYSSGERADAAHDLSHFLRVAVWTIQLGSGRFRWQAAFAAAAFHDLVSYPKNSPERRLASERAAVLAGAELPRFGFVGPELTEICDAIRTHSFSRGEEPLTELGRCLQDADRLEALGAIGLYRVLVTGVALGANFFNPIDPWAESRELDDSKHSVDHFFTKLLKLPGTMKTELGREEARRRAELLEVFLVQLGTELGRPCESLERSGRLGR